MSTFGAGRGSDTEGAGARTPCPTFPAVGGGSPITPNRARAHIRAMAALRQATWEATQFLSDAEVINYVKGVLREVESDAP